MNKLKNIVLLDFCSEKNRGDAAMQVGLLKLVNKFINEPIISIISVFGANQAKQLLNEYDHSSKFPVTILGGLKPTFYPLDNTENPSILSIELKQAFCFGINLILLFLLTIKTPFPILKVLLPLEYYDSLKHIRDADLIIWNGRNFRSRENQIVEIFRTLNVVYHALVCSSLSKPISCVGASVWHLNNPLSRLILKYTFSKCFFLSLREELSFNEAKLLLGGKSKTRISLLPDLSFAVFDIGKEIKAKREPISDSQFPKTIGLTIYDWKDDGAKVRNDYKKVISGVIEYCLKQNSKIVIIPQVTKKWEDSTSLASELVQAQDNKENISILNGDPTIDELLSIYSKLDFLIATRMHSAIFASFVGTPLVAISYDKGGKWSIVQELGYKDFIINYTDVTIPKLLEKIQKCWDGRNSILKVIGNNTQIKSNYVELNIKDLLEASPFF